MYFLYIDEAGCPGHLPHSKSDVQPVLALTGLILNQKHLPNLTKDFLTLKREFSPSLNFTHDLDIARHEMKGADLRKDIRKGNRNQKRHAFRFADKNLDILDKYEARLLAKIYIKNPGGSFDGKAVYTAAVQSLCTGFQNFLENQDGIGIVIADNRIPKLNSAVSHSIFTQKFQAKGDVYPRIVEMPLFGQSENHAMLQIADFVASIMLFPMASHVYCRGYVNSVHVNGNDQSILDRYAMRLKTLAYRFKDGNRHRGGITVHDAIANRSQSLLFNSVTPPAVVVPHASGDAKKDALQVVV